MNGMPSRTRLAAAMSPISDAGAANRVELASPHESITHTMARASRIDTRASLTFTPIEVSDGHSTPGPA